MFEEDFLTISDRNSDFTIKTIYATLLPKEHSPLYSFYFTPQMGT
jgi:hypothetical protein